MSQAGSITDASHELRPIASSERITALDVVRGVALIGIFLMNIEWFNRPIAELGMGLPVNATGADGLAGYLIYILVQGKFWTMFSLLFGMGFAVMLTRAERAGRSFLVPYMRRIAALAAFGALHHIFLWAGDILFSYAVAALCLLLLLWARWWALILIPVLCATVATAVPGAGWAWQVFVGMLFVLFGSWFLTTEARAGDGRALQVLGNAIRIVTFGKVVPGFTPTDAEIAEERSKLFLSLPWHTIVFGIMTTVALAISLAAGHLGPDAVPEEARWPMAIVAFFLGLVTWLSVRFKDPAEARPRRLGGAMYLIPFFVILSFGLLQMYGPERPKASEAQVAAAMVIAKAERADEKAGKVAPKKDEAKEAKKSPTEEAAIREANNRLDREEHQAEVAEERKLQTSGSYMDFVRFRAKEFGEHAAGEFGFATVLIGMFLLGYWFVRKGIMERPAEHLPLFRKMAAIGVPLGVGLGILSTLLATHATPGMERDPYQTATMMLMIGNLPAVLGYVATIVLLLHGPFKKIAVMAPLGRMALTNYLTHSLVSGLYFYGYAGGHYGMGRAMQVGFVFTVIALQVVFSHWWLSKFRYGPMEWLWRAITYWQIPAMRREAAPVLAGNATA